jgi:SET domain-containing protein
MMTARRPAYVIKRTCAGLGFFTLVSIPNDKRIVEYIGVILTRAEADRKGGKYLMNLDDEYLIDGSPRSNAARYINHSCQPNAQAFRTGARVWIRSIRDIEAGEEITYDYGHKYFDEQIRPTGCRCDLCFSK